MLEVSMDSMSLIATPSVDCGLIPAVRVVSDCSASDVLYKLHYTSGSAQHVRLNMFGHAGDGAEEQRCADQRGWPFVKVDLQSQAERTAKVVGQAIAAFPTEGGLLTSMHAEHLTSLFPDA